MDALKLAFRLLPYLYLFLALLVLISLVSVVIGIVTLLQESTHHAQDWRELATLMVLVVIAIVLAGIYIFNAMFLLKRTKRRTCIVLSLASCIGFPFGTILGAISLFLLTRREIKSEYFGDFGHRIAGS
jgi:ABC-type Fe3+ transport system permease subunit